MVLLSFTDQAVFLLIRFYALKVCILPKHQKFHWEFCNYFGKSTWKFPIIVKWMEKEGKRGNWQLLHSYCGASLFFLEVAIHLSIWLKVLKQYFPVLVKLIFLNLDHLLTCNWFNEVVTDYWYLFRIFLGWLDPFFLYHFVSQCWINEVSNWVWLLIIN